MLDYIAPSAFEVVSWRDVLKDVPTISKELLTKKSVATIKDEFLRHLPNGVEFGTAGKPTLTQRQTLIAAGENLLSLYFRQIYSGQKLFIDLRAERFRYLEGGKLNWEPNGLWIDFDAGFLDGLQSLYDGFYLEDAQAMNHALKKLGLVDESMSDTAKKELINLLEKHFGSGKTKAMRFFIKDFMHSFDQMFLFLKKHKVKLSADFLYLGIYLATLYLHLEKLGEAFDVQKSYIAGSSRVQLGAQDLL